MTTDKSLTCTEAIPLIPCFLDSELSESESADLQIHFANCLPCQESYQEQSKLHHFFQSQLRKELPAAPTTLRKDIRESLRAEERTDATSWIQQLFVGGSIAAAAAACLFAVYQLGPSSPAPTKTSVSPKAIVSSVYENQTPLRSTKAPTRRVSLQGNTQFSGSRTMKVGTTPVEHMRFSTKQGPVDVVIGPSSLFPTSGLQTRQVNGRNLAIGRFHDYNVVVLHDLDSTAYSFLSPSMTRTQLYDLVVRSNLVR